MPVLTPSTSLRPLRLLSPPPLSGPVSRSTTSPSSRSTRRSPLSSVSLRRSSVLTLRRSTLMGTYIEPVSSKHAKLMYLEQRCRCSRSRCWQLRFAHHRHPCPLTEVRGVRCCWYLQWGELQVVSLLGPLDVDHTSNRVVPRLLWSFRSCNSSLLHYTMYAIASLSSYSSILFYWRYLVVVPIFVPERGLDV